MRSPEQNGQMALLKGAPVFALGVWSLVVPAWQGAWTDKRPAGSTRAAAWYSFWVGLGLVLGSVGDWALELEIHHPRMFLVGLGAFLLGHVFYVVGFVQTGLDASNVLYAAAAGIPLLGYGAGLLSLLLQGIDKPELRIAVVIYAAVLLVMAWTATVWRGSEAVLKPSRSASGEQGAAAASVDPRALALLSPFPFYAAVVGALVFVVSDSILAINRFAVPIPNARFYTMLTYFFSQLAIEASSYFLLQDDRRVLALAKSK